MEPLTDIRREFLQEMINISFGRAAASLADLLNIFVTLDVPKVAEVNHAFIAKELEERMGIDSDIAVVQQAFYGDFSGEVLLAISAEIGRKAVEVMAQNGGFAPQLPLEQLEAEVLLEVGNIVIGACLGQFSHLLEKTLSYEAPNVLLRNGTVSRLGRGSQGQDRRALIVVTRFLLGERALSGFLFILLHQHWFDALYLAVDDFIDKLSAD